MDIRLLLLLTIIGFILVTVGLFGLYVDVNRRLLAVKKSMRNTSRVVANHDDRIKVIEQRDRDASDHVYICVGNDDSDIKYGGEGI